MPMSSTYMEATVQRSAIEGAIPDGEDYTKRTFEMRLFYNDHVVANAATTIDPWDIRNPKAIRGMIIALSDMKVTLAILYYDDNALSEYIQSYSVSKGNSVVVDWCVLNNVSVMK